jgi:hypothetical protein
MKRRHAPPPTDTVWAAMEYEQEEPAQEPEAAQAHLQLSHQGTLFQEPTFRELAIHYQQRARPLGKAKSTYSGEDSAIRHALEWLDRKGIERPNTADWKQYLDWRQSEACNKEGGLLNGKAGKVTALTADGHRAVLSKVYSTCRDAPARGWLPFGNPLSSPVMGARFQRDPNVPRSMAEPYITYPLLQAAMPDITAKAFLSLLRWHGLRVQEALAVPIPGSAVDKQMIRNRPRMLDVAAGTLTIAYQRSRDGVAFAKLKTEFSAATIRLQPEPLELMREALEWQRKQALKPSKQWLQRQGEATANYVFPYYKNHLDGLMERIREVAPQDFPRRVLGVDGGDAWHVFRHTMATEYVRDGVPKRLIHEQLRHRDMKTTDAYLNRLLAEVRGGDELLESFKRQQERMQQALRERSGSGLTLVKGSTT